MRMNGIILTATELRRRLASQGHLVRMLGEPTGGLDPRATPDTIVTVALDADPTLKEAYRERYFVYVRDGDDPFIAKRGSAMEVPESFARIAAESASSDFVAGPVHWLLMRLRRFPRVLLWPDLEYRPPDGDGLVHRGVLDELPELRARLDRVARPAEPVGALILDLASEEDAACLLEVAVRVGWSNENFYVSDESTSEVYELHHHEKLVAIVPEQHTRRLLLEELAELSDLFEDWSGYGSELDEDETVRDTDGNE